MTTPSFRIYLTANLLIYLLCGFAFFPEGLVHGFAALFFSAFFSSPTRMVLWICFVLVERHKPNIATGWVLLLLAVGVGVLVTVLFTNLVMGSLFSDVLLGLSFIVGIIGTLLQCRYINKYFKTLQHENERNHENN